MTRAGEPHRARRCCEAVRERCGATQEGLAYEAGITTGTLSQLERGISKAIAKALGVSMVELAKLTAKFEQ